MDSYDSLKKTGSMFFQSWNYQAAPQKEFSKVWGLGERQTSQSPPPLDFFLDGVSHSFQTDMP